MLKTYSEVLLSISRSHFITQQLVQWILKFQIVYIVSLKCGSGGGGWRVEM